MTEENTNIWPIPKFRFEVDFGSELQKIAFQEVSGLNVENQIKAVAKLTLLNFVFNF